jgi:hypothetical protein
MSEKAVSEMKLTAATGRALDQIGLWAVGAGHCSQISSTLNHLRKRPLPKQAKPDCHTKRRLLSKILSGDPQTQ